MFAKNYNYINTFNNNMKRKPEKSDNVENLN